MCNATPVRKVAAKAVYMAHATLQASEAKSTNGPDLRCLHVFRERYDPLCLNYTW